MLQKMKCLIIIQRLRCKPLRRFGTFAKDLSPTAFLALESLAEHFKVLTDTFSFS